MGNARANRYPRHGDQLNTICSHSSHLGCGNHFWVYRNLHRFKHITSSEADGCSLLKKLRLMLAFCRDEGANYVRHITASEVVFQAHGSNVKPGFSGRNQ